MAIVPVTYKTFYTEITVSNNHEIGYVVLEKINPSEVVQHRQDVTVSMNVSMNVMRECDG